MNRRGFGRSWGRKRNENKPRNPARDNPSASFHRRNFRLVAAPLLFIFSVLRTIALQLYVVLGILVCRTSILDRNHTRASARRDAEAGEPMTSKPHRSPGPGEPLLASQKRHHRKAFEYISKALKIDEEDAGKFTACNTVVRRVRSGHVVQSAGHLTYKSEVLGSIPGLATYFRLSFC